MYDVCRRYYVDVLARLTRPVVRVVALRRSLLFSCTSSRHVQSPRWRGKLIKQSWKASSCAADTLEPMFSLVLEGLKPVVLAFFLCSTRHNIAADMKMLLEIDPNLKVAREGAPRLEKLHKEKMDKMKDEAIGEHSAYNDSNGNILGTNSTRSSAM